MPLGTVKLSMGLTDKQKQELLTRLSQLMARVLHKPEKYVMVTIDDNAQIMMSGDADKPAAFLMIKSIGGLDPEINSQLCNQITMLIEELLEIDPARVYINFADIPSSAWGWNRSIFG